MNATFRPLSTADHLETARVCREAFADDAPLWRALKLAPNQQAIYWDLIVRLFLEVDQAVLLGAHIDGALGGAAIGWEDAQSPALSQQWLLGWRYWRRLGWRRLRALGDFLFTTAARSAPQRPCLRLYVLGVDHAHRGRGVGRALLDAFEQTAAERNLTVIQLECEADNPARHVYESCGYVTERTFAAVDIQWLIMTKEPD